MNANQAADYLQFHAREGGDFDWMHTLLVSAAEGCASKATLLAEYRSAWQLSLDCNVPGMMRDFYIARRREAARALAESFHY